MQNRNFKPTGNRRRSFAPHKRRTGGPKNSSVHYSRYINKAVPVEEEAPYEPTHTFDTFGLDQRTAATLRHIGYKQPSPIQDQSIPHALEGKDIIGLANTGTGKTAAFLLPTIEKLLSDRKLVSVLVLAPTRELAQQIDDEFRRFSAGQKLYSTLVVGGANINRQIQQIKRGPHVIIGTPGRIKDLINRRVLRQVGS